MKRSVPLLMVAAAMLAIACSQRSFENSLTTESQLSSGVDLGAYHTWKFAREEEYPLTRNPTLDDPGFRKSVGQFMIGEMAKMGYTKVDSLPDFVMMIQLMTENKFDEQKMNDIYQGYDMAWSQMSSEDYWKEGTLLLFAMDARTGKQIWVARAQARIDEQSDVSTKKDRFKKTLAMLLQDFPPAKK